jgi:hypothetical protein
MRVSRNVGTPIAGWFIMETPFKMDDLGVPLFQETSICKKTQTCYTRYNPRYGNFDVGKNT